MHGFMPPEVQALPAVLVMASAAVIGLAVAWCGLRAFRWMVRGE